MPLRKNSIVYTLTIKFVNPVVNNPALPCQGGHQVAIVSTGPGVSMVEVSRCLRENGFRDFRDFSGQGGALEGASPAWLAESRVSSNADLVRWVASFGRKRYKLKMIATLPANPMPSTPTQPAVVVPLPNQTLTTPGADLRAPKRDPSTIDNEDGEQDNSGRPAKAPMSEENETDIDVSSVSGGTYERVLRWRETVAMAGPGFILDDEVAQGRGLKVETRPEDDVFASRDKALLQGTLGMLVPFVSREDVDFFQTLEIQLAAQYASLLGRDHIIHRAYYIPYKNTVDSDLCETYSLLPGDKKQVIASELDRSVREIERKISDMRTRQSILMAML